MSGRLKRVWTREQQRQGDTVYTDWSWAGYRLERGRDTLAAREGRPWMLLRLNRSTGKLERVDTFATLERGMEAALGELERQ